MKQNKIGQYVRWGIAFFIRDPQRPTDTHFTCIPGQRIDTVKGPGVIVGGSLIVKLDRAPEGLHENARTWSFNLDNMQTKKGN